MWKLRQDLTMERTGRTDGKIVGMMTMMMTIAGTMTTMIAGMMTVGTMTMMMTTVGKADTVMEMGIMEAVITASTVRQQAEQ